MWIKKLFTLTAFIFSLTLYGQISEKFTVQWTENVQEFKVGTESFSTYVCTSCANSPSLNFQPIYTDAIDLGRNQTVQNVEIAITSSTVIPGQNINPTEKDLNFNWEVKQRRSNNRLVFEFNAIYFEAGSWKMVDEFTLNYIPTQNAGRRKGGTFKSNSVLAQGEWYRIGVTKNGVYRLSRNDLESLGIDVENVSPQSINIYGNAFGQLPYENSIDRPDDLLLNDIVLIGGEDDSFDEEDYILFYGKEPHTWTYNQEEGVFEHHKHLFVDTAYYFIGINTGDLPSRVTSISSSGSSPNQTVQSFDDYRFHEVDRENMIKSGREWYGEKFDVQTTYIFSGDEFNFPNLIPEEETVVRSDVISRSTASGATFQMTVGGTTVTDFISSTCTGVTCPFARPGELEIRSGNISPAMSIAINYQRSSPSDNGWLNWININARRQLKMAGAQLVFRDIRSVGPGNVSQFNLTNAGSIDEVWDVTDPTKPKSIQFNRTGDLITFNLQTQELREFIAFSGGFLSPGLFGSVPNQNLHALGTEEPIDMIIVSPSQFIDRAEELAEIHRNYPPSPLNVEVIELQDIYNEFSSGMRDITAIKWMMKMLFDRAGGNEEMMPRYLTLFGDGSYDNRNFTPGNTNFIPTYQSENSLSPATSYVSDDYFAFLSDDEGEGRLDQMDIAVGRLVVKSNSEATSVINKIRRYMSREPIAFDGGCVNCGNNILNRGSWRNVIALVADDEDSNSHMSNSNTIANLINESTRDFNIERIFSDAFQQIITPGGARYPDVNQAIDRRVRNGAFLINYIGHGGELGWAQERILNVPTILNWSNTKNLPVFMTATCEFSRFDDPLRTSAGEYVLLNGNGGGIALMTTTRLVYSGPNFVITSNFYESLLNRPENEDITRLGDISRETKNNAVSSGSTNHRNFSLIGDPGLPLAFPEHRINVTSITDTLGNPVDTLKALGIARVTGNVTFENGNVISDFNGQLSATVFDRVEEKSTLGNDGGNTFEYEAQENVVYRGNAGVTNGNFQFDFVIPKDISFAVDTTARISLYAVESVSDATGFIENLSIGDRDENAVDDGQGPELSVFMNDENFVNGGFTNNTPILLASVFDNDGINTVGSGIGHDITAIIDGNTASAIVLNDYYESDLNTYRSGRIQYQLDELEPGNHNIQIKVWDVHNNSSEQEIDFVVAENEEFAIRRVLNYPNPFTTNTEFFFEHNQSASFLNVLIQVYSVSGKLVKTINTVSNTDGFRNEPIEWDGRDDFGDRLATGVYVYKISVRNPAGEQVQKIEKLVIL